MRKTTTLLLLIAFCSATLGSEGSAHDAQPQVNLPADGNLSFRANTDPSDYVYFQGHAMATGLMAAYWEVHYTDSEPTSLQDATPVREMHLRFYPDTSSHSQLPSFLSPSGTTIQPQRVFLYRHRGPEDQPDMLLSAYTEDDMDDIRRLIENFPEDADSFLRHREGVMVQPVVITLDNLLTFVEADHRFVYGKMHSFTPVSASEYLLQQVPDSDAARFLGTPWIEMLYSPHSLAVHETPNQDARVIAELPSASTAIRKLRTIDEHWVLIESTGETQELVTGYARKSALFPVN